MSSDPVAALVPLGWSERVLSLFTSVATAGCQPARVTRVERAGAVVSRADGADHLMTASAPLAVGDWVAVTDAAITAVLPRWSALTRRDPSGAVQVLAANIDVVIVTAPADRPSPARIERELILAWESGAQPLVALTKADLAPVSLVEGLAARLVGVEVVAVSAVDRRGLDRLSALLQPTRTAVLFGPSGSGKSTLANALLREELLATGAVRDGDHRGRHTTTSRQLLALPDGGVLIDTPGLRSLALSGGGDLDRVFPEIEELAEGCRFRDCHHEAEPGCAVAAALSSGELDPSRLASYRKLANEAAFEDRRSDVHDRRVGNQRTKQERQRPDDPHSPGDE